MSRKCRENWSSRHYSCHPCSWSYLYRGRHLFTKSWLRAAITANTVLAKDIDTVLSTQNDVESCVVSLCIVCDNSEDGDSCGSGENWVAVLRQTECDRDSESVHRVRVGQSISVPQSADINTCSSPWEGHPKAMSSLGSGPGGSAAGTSPLLCLSLVSLFSRRRTPTIGLQFSQSFG